MSRGVCPPLVLVLVLATGAHLPAQAQWSLLSAPFGNPPARGGGQLFFDATRGALVLHGNAPENDMWEWDGSKWTKITPPSRPPEDGTIAYDTVRSRAVLFTWTGGRTWEWDGTTWTERVTPVAPPPRTEPAMAYDAARGRVVLFGGGFASWSVGDTWEWDGTSWTQRTPAQTPSPRGSTALAYDAVRQRVVLFGGLRFTWHADTWEWDGTNWIQRVASGPPPNYFHTLSYDAARQRVLLIGGWNALNSRVVWEWDGNVWQRQSPASSPLWRHTHAIAYDPTRQLTVLFGGYHTPTGAAYDDTWEWDGTGWAERTIRTGPEPRSGHGLAFDTARGEVILCGGWNNASLDDMWSWRGTAWAEIPVAERPSPRAGHGMVYDPVRDRVVLFGGFASGSSSSGGLVHDDTWEWDGTRWRALQPASRPSARGNAAMFFDRKRGRVLLHGGEWLSGLNPFGDTWEWDGTTWTQLASGPTEMRRSGHSVAHDPVRGREVTFGGWRYDDGCEETLSLADTWEWDGNAWSQVQTSSAPPTRGSYSMVHDPLRGRIVLLGGSGLSCGFSSIRYADTWEYAGGTWTLVHASSATGVVFDHRAVFDAVRSHVLVFGGVDLNRRYRGDTWSYATPFPAGYAPFGFGCAGTAGVPALAPSPLSLPWLGSPFALELRSVSAELPLALALGGSRTQWLSAPLPLSLTGLGMTGCTLWVSIDLLLPAATLARPQWTLPIPAQSALIGASVYCQAMAFDPSVSPAGVFWSNAGAARMGVR